MADYKELLRRAVEALPENNGAARRAVYEKARAALVGQLRAINPPLPARDITTHRLQLEDCIRQVEQEASEAVIAGMGAPADSPPPPVYFELPAPAKAPASSARPQITGRPAAKQPPSQAKEPPKALPAGGTIEDIIAAANAEAAPTESKPQKGARPDGRGKVSPIRLASPAPESDDGAAGDVEDLPPKPAAKSAPRQLPSIVARAEAAKGRSHSTAFGVPNGDKPYDAPRRGPTIEPRPAPGMAAAARGGHQAAVARQPVVEPVAFLEEPKVVAAMSAVREVEVDTEAEPQPMDPQGAIDRAIATLDREARGDHTPQIEDVANDDADEPPPAVNGKAGGIASMLAPKRNGARQAAPAIPVARNGKGARESLMPAAARGKGRNRDAAEPVMPRARAENDGGGMSAVTIFLIVFAVLLAGAGGAGYWAVTQGYVDLSQTFSPASATTVQAVATPDPAATATADASSPATGPGNTAAPAATTAPAAELAATEERLTPNPALTGSEPLALAATPKATEERLQPADVASADSAEAAVAALDPVNVPGSQSLLLEASDNGTTGAVPFSGTVEWSKGTDETGAPTLVGSADIPARNLGVDVLIRKNSDPSLPASHLMEINFRVADTFVGGSIAGLPGVLLKNEELVQGTPLVGASARVVGNSFLFALSASPEDLSNNTSLLTSRKWMDLALIYATGKRAIITLEKDSAAEGMFSEVFAAWGQTASVQ